MAQKKNIQKQDFSIYVKLFWMIFIGGILSILLLFFLASWGLFGVMPSFEKLENPASNLATEIISSDGITLGKFYNENRTPLKFTDLPESLTKALIATEDERFLEHSGIDARGTIRAMLSFGTSGGASTITQQLAKLLFHGEGSKNIVARITQKTKEWIIAVRLEKQYTKEEILTMYLNKADFINNAVGIRSAAKVYFRKEPKNLTVDEGAMLIGMLKNPSLFNPIRRKETAKKRRNVVLKQMEKNGFLSTADKEKYQALPIKLKYSPESNNEGLATYFREYLREYMKKWVKKNKKPDDTNYNIYTDGLKIYTSIDSRIQKYAEEAVVEHLSNLQEEFFAQNKTNDNIPFVNLSIEETNKIIDRAIKSSDRWKIMKERNISDNEILKSFRVKTDMKIFTWKGEKDTIMTPIDSIRYYKQFLQTGMMSMEPQTGQVKAWVGGINPKYFKYDHVAQGSRQAGSTFKPFVYATAIDQLHYSPCDSIMDSPYTIPKGKYGVSDDWTPRNSDRKYKGMVTLKYALAHSINSVTAKLIDKVGPQAVVDLTKKLGVHSYIPAQPSIALGAVEITVSDMVAAYSTFANQGVYVKPQIINRIEDKNGTVLYRSITETRDVLNKDVSFTIIKLLEGIIEIGSGARLRSTWSGGGPVYKRITGYPYKFTNPIAGKTGTTQNQSDAWFIGMVPNLATGIWVGNEDRAAHFKTLTYGQGATMALPIWAIFMKKCYADSRLSISKDDFERPANLSINVDCRKKEIESTETDEFDF